MRPCLFIVGSMKEDRFLGRSVKSEKWPLGYVYTVHVRANCCSRHGSELRTTRSKAGGNNNLPFYLIHDVIFLPV